MTKPVKPPTTYEMQLEKLENRGLIIEDRNFAMTILSRINYYRLSAYTLTFKTNDVFHDGVTFELLYRHYEFDSRLRNHIMKIIEMIEIAFRTHIAYIVAHHYGPLAYTDRKVFNPDVGYSEKHNRFVQEILYKIEDSDAIFIDHHKKNYEGVPIWVVVELMSFADVSKFYRNMVIRDRRQIAKTYYKLHYKEISNWLHCFTVVRNRCAHYSRLFNQKLSINVRMRVEDDHLGIKVDQLFAILFNAKYLITDKSFWDTWVIQLGALTEAFPEVDLALLGFPNQWDKLLFS